ncbi:MAG TPA: hypothetical protein VIP46_03535, partial [Pyrinomonadaceae bacterium]
MRKLLIAVSLVLTFASAAAADVLRLKDGTSVEADEVWDSPEGVWYRRGGVTYHVERALVEKIERARQSAGDGRGAGGAT